MVNKTRIVLQKSIWQDSMQVYIRRYIPLGDKYKSEYFNGKGWQEIKEMEIVEPSLLLDITESQHLMDNLWDCGIRPIEGNGSAGSMRATEKHLEDMRKIAFIYIENNKEK